MLQGFWTYLLSPSELSPETSPVEDRNNCKETKNMYVDRLKSYTPNEKPVFHSWKQQPPRKGFKNLPETILLKVRFDPVYQHRRLFVVWALAIDQ